MNENHLPRKYTGKGGLFHAMVTRIERSENLREFFVEWFSPKTGKSVTL